MRALIDRKQIEPLSIEDIPVDVRDKHYVHNQVQANSEWDVVHNLNKKPNVQVFNEQNQLIVAFVEYIDNNKLMVKFNESWCGSVVCN